MVRESRIVANLLIEKATSEQWDQAIRVDNLLQKRTPASAKRNAQAIRKRLERLEPEFWRALRDGDEELATQVALYAALERNLLLVEFMETVVRDAYITHLDKLEHFLWAEFLEDCAHRDPTVSEWKESSKKKMGQVVFRILAESGYLVSTRSLKLQPVRIRPELNQLLMDNHQQRLLACMEVSR